MQDPKVLHLVKLIIKAGGKKGVPQGGPFSPLAANIYLNEVDWYFDDLRRKTAEGPYEAINYHRFADDMVITISGHWSKRGWAERALQRLQGVTSDQPVRSRAVRWGLQSGARPKRAGQCAKCCAPSHDRVGCGSYLNGARCHRQESRVQPGSIDIGGNP